MAVDRVVASYLGELGDLLAAHRYRERILNEVAEHLRERIEFLVAAGSSELDAADAAITAFGDPRTYAESFMSIRAMPTQFTRWCGLAGLWGPLVLLATAPSQAQDGEQVPWLLLVPFAFLVAGLAGVIARTRGSFGRLRGWIASTLIIVGASVGATGGYGLLGIVCTVAVLAGLSMLLQTTFRIGALPRPATLMIAVAGVALVAMIGSEMPEQSAPIYVAGIALLIGWCWLQYTLWSESAARKRPS